MKIIIIGKRDQMGTTPLIRIKGLSRMQYLFDWDKDSRHYAYEPKSQREADDIFRAQGKLYRRMYFSVLMDAPEEPKKEEPKPKKSKPKAKPVLQAVEKVSAED